MKGIQILVFLLMLTTVSIAGVGKEDIDEIRELTKAGQFQQALEKQLWFHEESKSSPGMAGVRLSYAISAWIELCEKYPPALEALIEVRDKDKNVLLSGNGSFQNFHDLSAINRKLGQDEDTLELFLILDEKYPKQSARYYKVAEDLLIAKKMYDICAKYIGDPIRRCERSRHDRESLLSLARTNPKMNDSIFLNS